MGTSATNITYGTLTGSSYGFSISPTTDRDERPKTPTGLVVTRAVQTKDGWLGQVIVDKEIIWEGGPESDGEDAIQAANGRVVDVFKALLAPPTRRRRDD